MTSPASFNIVLCLAGAVSAGAYTAGVIDFLLEALDTWEARKISDPNSTPDHRVSLIGVTGASAGGMTAGLMLAELMDRRPPVQARPIAAAPASRLYRSWVEDISAEALLEVDVRKPIPEPVTALLNAKRVEQILEAAFAKLAPKARPSYVNPRFAIGLTLSNLRGIPYQAEFTASGSKHYLGMLKHANVLKVVIEDRANSQAGDFLAIQWPDLGKNTEAVSLFKTALLATGAFPFALPARRLSLGLRDRKALYGPEDQGLTPGFGSRLLDYVFDSVDGGMMNNIPLEFAEALLAQPESFGSPASAGALLAVAPFPEGEVLSEQEEPPAIPGLGSLVMQILAALKNQTRFKPEFLQQVINDNDYSRFMISPRRSQPGVGEPNSKSYVDGSEAIASGGLGGFSGFFSEAFRMHDYALGRRNAQRFLSEHFMLPEGSPLFASWHTKRFADHYRRDGHLPIIPVMPGLSTKIDEHAWPTLGERQLNDLTMRIGLRLDYLAKPLARTFGASGFGLQALHLAYTLFRKQIINKVKNTVKTDLQRRGQLK